MKTDNHTIDEMAASDWAAVREIYIQGITTGHATFNTTPPLWEQWDKSHLPACRLVARADERVVGWAALSPISGMPAYAGVAEVSIYVAEDQRSSGIGKALLRGLVEASESAGIWTLEAKILAENTASLALHASCGFRTVGSRERVGQLNGVWRDAMLLERRSDSVGI
ncbi:MAG: N-acetyltransferase [SAR202 cluster bacterium Io17-Chloro-G9]|nr:MAG: N-acetyltransferase [SAR202 cluster bacterium Io17-Chloro-G9]